MTTSWQQADTELEKRVKKFRFKNPKTPYAEAVDIILEDDVELAAAYAGVDSPRTANIKRQFALDRKLKQNPDDPAGDITSYQYKVTMAEAMGWRDAARIYGGIDLEKEIKEKIQKEIFDLENKKIQCENIIASYPDEMKRQKEIIERLQAKLGSNIGHTPSLPEVANEQNKLLKLERELSDAEDELPIIETRLATLQKKLAKIESGKKFSRQNRYATPSEELTERAKAYAREYEIDYGTAVDEIMEEDLVLSTAYNLYDVDTLLGLNG